ncbi:MAG: ribonuclease PH [Pseudomonadaceae bacterium]|nr:ribonuclease PH [Pseudomonadaceae bacterium]
MSYRNSGRKPDELRDVSLSTGVNPYAEGSCQISWGHTKVLCTASVQANVPRWLKGQGKGWLTAEYGMLPRATGERVDREAVKGKQGGRTVEIQRLIGRSLRSVCDLAVLDGFTLYIDCDVLVADGGTRVASITGAYVAAALAVQDMMAKGQIARNPFVSEVAAVSCGLSEQGAILDMDYGEDSTTIADGNFVMDGRGNWIELQMTAEQRPLGHIERDTMMVLAEKGISELIALQRAALAAV